VIDAWSRESLLKVSHVFYGPIRAFVLVPRVGNYSEIHELAENIFDLNKIKRRKAEIANEKALIEIVNQSGDSEITGKIKKLLNERFSYKNVSVLKNVPSSTSKETTVHDQTNGSVPFTLDEIATRLPAQVSYEKFYSSSSSQNSDLIIVIGKDLVSKYNMEEDTLEDLNNARDEEEILINSKK